MTKQDNLPHPIPPAQQDDDVGQQETWPGFSSHSRLLVVAPHPDDESIGCGGLLALYGAQCDVLILTDGRRGKSKKHPNLSDEEVIALLKREALSAMGIAGVREVFFLGIPDSQLLQNRKRAEQFDVSPYDFVFIPNDKEKHIDHLATNYIFRKMASKMKPKARLYGYEVWSPLKHVDTVLNISSVEEKKGEIIRCHASQMENVDYLDAIKGLNHYRALMFQATSVEAFESIPRHWPEILAAYWKRLRLGFGLFRLKLRAKFF